MAQNDVMIYSLSTCGHCKSTKRLLNECGVAYD
ncbi:MAG: glutaredoxin, partial [Thermodesulfobacteriota bacterium]|nr:glutaredoxin [Thermodesulfobacteriota bacterium]